MMTKSKTRASERGKKKKSKKIKKYIYKTRNLRGLRLSKKIMKTDDTTNRAALFKTNKKNIKIKN